MSCLFSLFVKRTIINYRCWLIGIISLWVHGLHVLGDTISSSGDSSLNSMMIGRWSRIKLFSKLFIRLLDLFGKRLLFFHECLLVMIRLFKSVWIYTLMLLKNYQLDLTINIWWDHLGWYFGIEVGLSDRYCSWRKIWKINVKIILEEKRKYGSTNVHWLLKS